MQPVNDTIKPIPQRDADSAPYWDGANDNKFMYQYCNSCNKGQFYSRTLCSHCQSEDLTWKQAAGTGKVASYSLVHRAPIKPFFGDAPYVLALIDLDEGFRFMCNVLNCDPESVRIDMPVRVIFEERPGSDQKIPQVEPV